MRISTIILAGTLALAAGGVHAASPPDACKLIGAPAAAKVLGTQVTVKPINTYGEDASHCFYSTGHIHGGFSLLVAHIPYKNASTELADQKKTALDTWPSSMAKPGFTDVKGLGEAATLLKGQGFFQLHVLAHGTSMVINIDQNANDEAVARAEKLARIAIGNLQ